MTISSATPDPAAGKSPQVPVQDQTAGEPVLGGEVVREAGTLPPVTFDPVSVESAVHLLLEAMDEQAVEELSPEGYEGMPEDELALELLAILAAAKISGYSLGRCVVENLS